MTTTDSVFSQLAAKKGKSSAKVTTDLTSAANSAGANAPISLGLGITVDASLVNNDLVKIEQYVDTQTLSNAGLLKKKETDEIMGEGWGDEDSDTADEVLVGSGDNAGLTVGSHLSLLSEEDVSHSNKQAGRQVRKWGDVTTTATIAVHPIPEEIETPNHLQPVVEKKAEDEEKPTPSTAKYVAPGRNRSGISSARGRLAARQHISKLIASGEENFPSLGGGSSSRASSVRKEAEEPAVATRKKLPVKESAGASSSSSSRSSRVVEITVTEESPEDTKNQDFGLGSAPMLFEELLKDIEPATELLNSVGFDEEASRLKFVNRKKRPKKPFLISA